MKLNEDAPENTFPLPLSIPLVSSHHQNQFKIKMRLISEPNIFVKGKTYLNILNWFHFSLYGSFSHLVNVNGHSFLFEKRYQQTKSLNSTLGTSKDSKGVVAYVPFGF